MDATSTLLDEIAHTWPARRCCQREQTAQFVASLLRDRTREDLRKVRTPQLAVLAKSQARAHLGVVFEDVIDAAPVTFLRARNPKALTARSGNPGQRRPCDIAAMVRGELAAVGCLSLENGIYNAPLFLSLVEHHGGRLAAQVAALRRIDLPRSAARLALRPGTTLSHPRRQVMFTQANAQRSQEAAAAIVPQLRRYLEVEGHRLPPHLRAAAELRVGHPALPLSELCVLAQPALSKDSFAGRLRRVTQLAQAWDNLEAQVRKTDATEAR